MSLMRAMNAKTGRYYVFMEIVFILAIFLIIWWILDLFLTPLWLRVATHTLMILLPLAVLFLKRKNIVEYGFKPRDLRFSLIVGITFSMILLLLPSGYLLITGKFRLPEFTITFWIYTVINAFIVIGFPEEFLFRGYMQTRLNDELNKPFVSGEIEFGWGLIIASLIFGFLHVLNPFNPLKGRFVFDWLSITWTTLAGFVFGFLREQTEDILAPTIVHGAIDFALSLIHI